MDVAKVSYRDPHAAELFTESLRETGFGVLTDHPIDSALVNEVFEEWAEFFRSREKVRYTFEPARQAGYFPFRSENAKDSPIKDLKEFFHLYPWHPLPDGMSTRSRRLFHEMTRLGGELLSWVEAHTPEDTRSHFEMPLKDTIVDSPEILLRVIHYPPLTGGEEQGAIRAAAHEDINLITLLPAATAPGLEVLDTAGRWHSVPCDPGSIVVNNGDMLQMATRGLYRSTTHRVVNPMGEEAKSARYSMPLFLHPRPEVRLSDEHTAASYLRQRLIEIGLLQEGQSKAGHAPLKG